MLKDIVRYKLTYVLILLNLIAYVFSAVYSQSLMDMDIEVLLDMGASYAPFILIKEQWWRLGTAMFLHGGMTHILMNMFSLYLVGRAVEMYLSHKSYLSIYLFAGLIGGLFSLYVHPQSVGVGASGAIFGLFGALAGFFLANKYKIASHTKAFMKDFSIIIGINLVIGLSIESIDLSAHIAGLIIGFLGGFLLSKNPKFIVLYMALAGIVSVLMAYYLPLYYAQNFV
ncbi:MAG: rhomboid family intramembrane serine protease [Sulfurovum sp.]|nr:rhomboid family intramembrane serine protease [Sulfurovum sp.]